MWSIRELAELVLLMARGLERLLLTSRDFRELEMGLFRLGQETARQLLLSALMRLDEELMESRDKQRLKLVHKKPRTLLTWGGELQFERRYYIDRETREGRFLLDEFLGLEARQRLSPVVEEVAVSFAVNMPYRRAAECVKESTLGTVEVTAMQVWQAMQKTGEAAKQRSAERRQAIFEAGEEPPGQDKLETLNVEVDGVNVPTNRKDGHSQRLELKLAVGYTGKEETASGSIRLLDRRVHAGVSDSATFFEETVAEFAHKWDLFNCDDITYGCDGAEWVKKGREYFPGAKFRLDPFHLRRALREGAGHVPEIYGRVCEAIAEGVPWSTMAEILDEGIKRTRGQRRQRMRKLKQYLANNWEGIRNNPTARELGAIEGQVFHHITRRMKRHGAHWSRNGADHMVRLLALRGNGELKEFTPHRPQRNSQLIESVAQKPMISHDPKDGTVEDVAEWLQARLPALYGPHAGRTWIKYVLRSLVKGDRNIA